MYGTTLRRGIASTFTLALASAAFALVLLAPAAAACEDPDALVDARVHEDACGTVLAVSVHGAATGTGDCRGVGCFTVSGTGDAGTTADAECASGAGVTCIAVSGTGNAENEGRHLSCGTATGTVAAGCIAVSGTGNASNAAGNQACGQAWQGASTGCIAVSGEGDAENATWSSCGNVHQFRFFEGQWLWVDSGHGCVAATLLP